MLVLKQVWEGVSVGKCEWESCASFGGHECGRGVSVGRCKYRKGESVGECRVWEG